LKILLNNLKLKLELSSSLNILFIWEIDALKERRRHSVKCFGALTYKAARKVVNLIILLNTYTGTNKIFAHR